MGKLLRYGGWALLGLAVLWAVAKVVSIVLGFISWLVSTVVTLAVAALLLYLAYVLASKYLAGNDGAKSRSRSQSKSREREKIFE